MSFEGSRESLLEMTNPLIGAEAEADKEKMRAEPLIIVERKAEEARKLQELTLCPLSLPLPLPRPLLHSQPYLRQKKLWFSGQDRGQWTEGHDRTGQVRTGGRT